MANLMKKYRVLDFEWCQAHPERVARREYARAQRAAERAAEHAARVVQRATERKAAQRVRYEFGMMLWAAKSRAKKSGRECNLTLAHILSIWPASNCCPCCGNKFEKHTPHAPSLDRIDHAGGYLIGHVRILCYRCNTLRRNGTPEEFYNLFLLDADPALRKRLRVTQ